MLRQDALALVHDIASRPERNGTCVKLGKRTHADSENERILRAAFAALLRNGPKSTFGGSPLDAAVGSRPCVSRRRRPRQRC